MTRGRIAWAIAAADVVALVAVTTVPMPFDPAAILYVLGVASFAGVGALLINRVPNNPIGFLLLAAGTLLVAAITVGMYADVGASQQPPWPLASSARVAGDVLFFFPFLISVVLVPLIFPDGRLISPRFRWAVACAGTAVVLWVLGAGRLVSSAVVDILLLLSIVASFACAILALWIRYRRGSPTERQQVKWLLADVGVALVALIPSLVLSYPYPFLSEILSGIAVIAMLLMPVVVAIAVTRYRLYEIDRIVSRGIAYAAAIGALALVFGAIVVILSTLLAEVAQGESIAVAASTLAVFALFQPILRSIKRRVDRRFNRAQYDAQRTIEAFSAHVRDEVDLPTLRDALVATAVGAVDPMRSDVWLRPQGGRS
jgi:hypothetical protein